MHETVQNIDKAVEQLHFVNYQVILLFIFDMFFNVGKHLEWVSQFFITYIIQCYLYNMFLISSCFHQVLMKRLNNKKDLPQRLIPVTIFIKDVCFHPISSLMYLSRLIIIAFNKYVISDNFVNCKCRHYKLNFQHNHI